MRFDAIPRWAAALTLTAALAVPAAAGAVPIAQQEKPEQSSVADVCGDPKASDSDFCMPASRLQNIIINGELDLLFRKGTAEGVAGALVLYPKWSGAGLEKPIIFKAKWKSSKKGGEGFNNAPRKEFAAYQIQKLFMDDDEYSVPPTTGRCIPMDQYTSEFAPKGVQTWPESNCVFGTLAYWVRNVTAAPYYEKDLWDKDPKYKRAMAGFNLLTYLINHRDSRDANFLRSADPKNPRILAIDNGIAFSGFRNTRGFFWFAAYPAEADYALIQVPALAKVHVDRLRKLTKEELTKKLAVVQQFTLEPNSMKEVPATARLEGKKGVRTDGKIVQFGLTDAEIATMWTRVEDLLRRVDSGEIKTF